MSKGSFRRFVLKGTTTAVALTLLFSVNPQEMAHASDSAITCPALRSVIRNVVALSLDSNENLLVLEGGSSSNGGYSGGGPEVNLIQKVDRTTGMTTLVAGGWQRDFPGNARIGLPGFHGDGGSAVDSGIWYPIGIGADSSGNTYFSDYGLFQLNLGARTFRNNDHSNRIRKISSSGVITTIAGTGDFGFSNNGTSATAAELAGPRAIAINSIGDIYFVDSLNYVIRKINHLNNQISTIAGTGIAATGVETGTATSVNIGIPNSLAFDSSGNLYFADGQFNVIEKITLSTSSPQISVVAGSQDTTPSNTSIRGEFSLATSIPLLEPKSLVIDSDNNLYYLDNYGWSLRKISAATGRITTLAGNGDWTTQTVEARNQGAPVSKASGGAGITQNIDSNAIAIDSHGKIFLSDGSTIAVLNQTDGKLSHLTGGYPDSNDSDQKLSPFCGQSSIAAGAEPNSQVATIPSGAVVATIPATSSLPATTLNFGGSVPDSVTLVPVVTNPASRSATPFTISESTKIVDIQITGTFTGSATVCLDGASTDHLFHYTGTPAAWVELPSRTYVDGQVCGVTTSFSPFAAAAPAPTAPVVVYVPPTPVPYLKTLTNPQIHLSGDKFVCTAGTYNSGYTLDGVIQGSATALYTPASYTFNLLFNQVAQNALAVTAAKNSASWSVSSAPAGALVSCSVTVTANSLKNTDSSTANPAAVSAALTTQSQSASAAESAYNAAVSANSKSYQKALVDNRAAWRANVDKVRAAYLAELTRINGLPYSKANSELKSAALKTYIAAQKKTAVDYKASGPAALVVRDLANKAALDAKTAAIVKANSVYGTFIESIGYGVLVP